MVPVINDEKEHRKLMTHSPSGDRMRHRPIEHRRILPGEGLFEQATSPATNASTTIPTELHGDTDRRIIVSMPFPA